MNDEHAREDRDAHHHPRATPRPLDLSRDLAALVEIAADPDEPQDLLRRGLDWLARVIRYDLATAFTLEGGRLVAQVARGPLAGPAVRAHSLSLEEFPSLRETLETRRARAFREDDHLHGDGDPYDGVLDLPPGHACMVVPLCAGDRCLGLVTLDRAVCEPYDEATVLLVEVYGQVLAIALRLLEQRQLLERVRAQDEERVALLEARVHGTPGEGQLEASASPAMQGVLERARQVAQVDTPVLVLGETGTGKERLARAIHRWSRRAERPFVVVNTAAIPHELLESELFGHARGSFTGATRDRAGRFQTANGGTLLLDEIGELPLDLQAKLLRVLQDGTFQAVGSDREVKVDVRLLAATHVDLERAVETGRFRADLYYRLAVFPLRLPALRERREDLPALAGAVLREQVARTGRRGMTLTPGALARLAEHDWPGNVRELANVLERAAILARGPKLDASDLDLGVSPARIGGRVRAGRLEHEGDDEDDGDGEVPTLDEVQRRHIARVLRRTDGRLYGKDGAAELLGLKPSTLQSRMEKLGLGR
jgi:transcriptional regulator with GAF, ATPase, and Fis domain